MSVIQSGIDLGSTNLSPEYAKNINSEGKTLQAEGLDKKIENQKVVKEQATADKAVESGSNKEPLTPEQLEKVAQQLQSFVGEMNRGLEFTVDKDSGRDVIKVIDKSSGDMLKQYPSEEVLSLVAKLSDMVGGFIDAKV